MFRQLLNWRTALAIIAILIISGTVIYSQYLARKIARDEKLKVEQWIDASKSLINAQETSDITFAFRIVKDNQSIPIIETNEKDSITNWINLDSAKAANNPDYITKKLRQFKAQNPAIIWTDPNDSTRLNRYYYGNSRLLNEVRY